MSNSVTISGFASRTLSLLFTCAALAGFSTSAAAQAAPQLLPYTVATVAGGGTLGTTGVVTTYSPTASPFTVGQACATGSSLKATDTAGDGCLATQVRLSVPRAAAADSEGNLFIVDSNNQSIRRVDAHTGIITTIAGSVAGTPVYPASGALCPDGVNHATSAWGDGCVATGIILAAPEGLTVDAQGNVWFTDYQLGSVREVSKSTGILNTIVNTTGTVGYKADNLSYTKSGITAANGLLFHPYGLTFDKNGNLYIADNYNNVVDVVNLGSTAVTIAGNTIAAGEIFTVAGSGCPYVSQAQSASESTTSSCDSVYGHSNGTSPYPSTGSTLDSPYQVAVDNSGNIYIADEYPYDVRVINGSTGVISTFAGVLSSHMATTATLPRGLANATALGSIYGVATDPLGNVYISLFQSPLSIVARVDIATGEIYPIAGQYDTAVPTAYGGTAAPAGALPCAAKTDAFGDGCPGTQATFWRPYQPFVDAAGNVYITDQFNFLIRKVSVGTQFPAAAIGSPLTQNIEVHFGAGDGPAASSAYSLPTGFTEFSTGTAACTTNSDTTQDCVVPVTFTPAAAGVRTAPLTVTSGKGLVSSFALTGTGLAAVLAVDPGTQSSLASNGVASVSDIALDAVGNIYAAVPGASSIVKVTPAGVESNLGSGLSGANAVAVDAAGNVYAALASKVYEIPANGGSQVVLGSFTAPSGLAVDSYGDLFVSDSAADTVSEILASSGAQVVLANSSRVPSLSGPAGLAVDTYGNVFVANTIGNSVIELPFNGRAAVTLGSGLSAPTSVAIDPAGSLYVADKGNKRIVYIPNESGTLNSSDQLAVVTGLGTPSGVAIAAGGTIYVADSYANAIYTFTRNAATINLGNALTAIGNEGAATNQAPADIISMGTQPAAFGSTFASVTGNAEDFSLSPSSIPSSSEFPMAGYGVELTASFTPTALGARSATYTFASTTPSTPPTLTLNGAGIQPHDSTNTLLTTTPPTGQTSWIYGQTVAMNISVAVNNGLPAPTGSVSVQVDGGTANTVQLTVGTTTTPSTATFSIPALSAGPHSIYVGYGGDTESSASNNTLNLTLAQAPLTVTASTLNKPFDAPLPILTGIFSGVVNNDAIGVTYGTTAVWNSPVLAAGYPIVPAVSGTALSNYTVTVNNGTLFVTPDSTVVALTTSATSVNSTTQVTLTATASNQTSYAGGTAPTGSVTFYNTVGTTTTKIGTAVLNSSGVATFTTSFAVTGASTNNAVTAVYSGDTNFLTSTSAALGIVSGTPTFGLTQTSNSSLTVAPGQSGLFSFTLLPTFGYDGTIAFSCTAPSATITCSFSPSSVAENGSSTSSLIAVTINSQTATSAVGSRPMKGLGNLPLSLAALPGLALLIGFGGLRRRLLRGSRSLLLLAVCLAALGFSGCSSKPVLVSTPAGAQTVTIVASGTGGSFASVTQQFTVTLNVQ